MVTGNVDSETLIKKLIKTGKHAELWPEKADSKKKKQPKPENKEKEKQSDAESGEESNQSGNTQKEAVKVVVQDTPTNAEGGNLSKNSNEGCGVNVVKVSEVPVTGKTGVQFQEPKPEVKQTVVLPAGDPPAAAEKKVSIAVQAGNGNNDNEAGNEKSGGGSGGKKKKMKGKKGNSNNNNNGGNDGGEHFGDAPASTGSANPSHGPVPIPYPSNQSPPRQPIYHQYPPHYYSSPVYTVSHHTAYPSSSYSAAYHTSPQPYSYAHVHYPGMGTEMEPPPYDSESYTSQPSNSSFEFFSDENPNGCSIM